MQPFSIHNERCRITDVPGECPIERIATSRDVAKLAKVSQATVSRVLSGSTQVTPKTRQRVLAAAETLGYYVNETARSMRTQRSKSIGIILPSLINPFYAETAHTIYKHAKQSGWSTLIELTLNNPALNRGVVNDLIARRVEGLLLASVSAQNPYVETYFRDPVVPCVMYNRRLSQDIGNWVVLDNRKGARQATEYLLSQGHRDILFLSGDLAYSTAIERLEGYQDTMHQRNLRPRVIYGNFEYAQGYALVRETLDTLARERKLPTAIFAANDLMAFAAIDAMTDKEIRAKADIAVIGFDDISMSSRRGINLTTVSQRRDVMAKATLDALFQLIDQPHLVVRQLIEPQLIIRDTA